MADLRTEGKFDRIKGRARVIWGEPDRRRLRQGLREHRGPHRPDQGEDGRDIGGNQSEAGRPLRRGRGTRHAGNPRDRTRGSLALRRNPTLNKRLDFESGLSTCYNLQMLQCLRNARNRECYSKKALRPLSSGHRMWM